MVGNVVNNIIGTKYSEYCPYCGRKMIKYKDNNTVRGYYTVCKSKRCPYYLNNEANEYIEV